MNGAGPVHGKEASKGAGGEGQVVWLEMGSVAVALG